MVVDPPVSGPRLVPLIRGVTPSLGVPPFLGGDSGPRLVPLIRGATPSLGVPPFLGGDTVPLSRGVDTGNDTLPLVPLIRGVTPSLGVPPFLGGDTVPLNRGVDTGDDIFPVPPLRFPPARLSPISWGHTETEGQLYRDPLDTPRDTGDFSPCTSEPPGPPLQHGVDSVALRALFGLTRPPLLGPVSLRQFFPDLPPHSSFEDLVAEAADLYLAVSPNQRAVDSAKRLFAEDPSLRIDTVAAQAALLRARSIGLRALLQERCDSVKHRTCQPGVFIPDTPNPGYPLVPAYPTPGAISAFRSTGGGIHVRLSEGFIPQGEAVSHSYQRNSDDHLAIERLAAADQALGLTLILPKEGITSLLDGLTLQISPSFIAAKTGSEGGRKCDDYTRSGINTPEKRIWFKDSFGPYSLPTISFICDRILRLDPSRGPVYLWKNDLSAFFRRIPIHPTSCLLLATEVVINGVTYLLIPITAIFGLQDSNAFAKCASEIINAKNFALDFAQFLEQRRTLFIDDTIGWGLFADCQSFNLSNPVHADAVVGSEATNQKKSEIGQVMTILGTVLDTSDFTVRLSSVMFLKLLCLLFVEIPLGILPGDLISMHLLQRAASYMISVSEIVTAMRAFNRALYRMTRGLRDAHLITSIRLSADAWQDIKAWRIFLRTQFDNPSALRTHMSTVVLLHRLPSESPLEYSTRRQNSAHTIISTDASTGSNGMWGGGVVIMTPSLTPIACGLFTIAYFSTYLHTCPMKEKVEHINVFEFMMALVGLQALVDRAATLRPTYLRPDQPWHIHMLNDNTSAMWWLIKFKSNHPIHTFLLRLFSQMQITYNVVVTVSYIPSDDNWLADALSRQWDSPRGALARTLLEPLCTITSLPPWWHDLEELSLTPSHALWDRHLSHSTISLDVVGVNSRNCTTSPPTSSLLHSL
jgi:fumarate reductase subunit D